MTSSWLITSAVTLLPCKVTFWATFSSFSFCIAHIVEYRKIKYARTVTLQNILEKNAKPMGIWKENHASISLVLLKASSCMPPPYLPLCKCQIGTCTVGESESWVIFFSFHMTSVHSILMNLYQNMEWLTGDGAGPEGFWVMVAILLLPPAIFETLYITNWHCI